jgi:hypothetical protein
MRAFLIVCAVLWAIVFVAWTVGEIGGVLS